MRMDMPSDLDAKRPLGSEGSGEQIFYTRPLQTPIVALRVCACSLAVSYPYVALFPTHG